MKNEKTILAIVYTLISFLCVGTVLLFGLIFLKYKDISNNKSATSYDVVDFQPSAKKEKEITVYITDTGECYHRRRCGSLKYSHNEIILSQAVKQGYYPCNLCDPPSLE